MSASSLSVPRPASAAAATPAASGPWRPALLVHVTWWMVCAAYGLLKLESAVGARGWQVDLDVYRRGGLAVVRGEDLYSVSIHGLRFTYPPFAAVVGALTGPLSSVAACVLLLVLTVSALVGVLLVVGRRLDLPPLVVVSVAAGTLVSEPVFRTLLLGQVNALLMALVVLDLLVVRRGRQGLLVGLAAGVKLVPGIFVLYFLLRRDRRGVLLSGAGFLATVLVGAVLDPRGSRWYWSGGAFTLDKFGLAGVIAPDNQSLSVAVDRFRHDSTLPTAVTLVAGLLAVAAAALVARRCLARGDQVAAVLALALGGLLASPISWTHHWVWLAPVVLLLVARRRVVAAVVVSVVPLLGPMWLLPRRAPFVNDLPLAQNVVGASYTLLGLALLVVLWRLPAASATSALPLGAAREAAPSQGVEDAARPVSHTPGRRRGVFLRPTRTRLERGAVAVEAAIVLPVVLLIFIAIFEYGLVFKDWLGVVSATRAGARTASALSANGGATDYGFATQAAAQMAATSAAVDLNSVKALWVYKADANGNPDGGASFTSCTVCDKFTWNGSSFVPVPGQTNFYSSNLVTCANQPMSRTRIGVYMQLQHKSITGFIFNSLTVSEHVVMIAEPQPGSPSC